jgi:hypothetical protein
MKKTVFLFSTLILLGTVDAHAEGSLTSSLSGFDLDRDTVVLMRKNEKMIFDMEACDYKIVPLHEQIVEENESTKSSWKSYLTSGVCEVGKGVANLGWSATKLGANATLNVTTDFIGWGLRTAVAYNVAYYDTKAVEWIACKSLNCVTSLILGPPAGAAAEAVLNATFQVGRYIVPGYEALIAGAATPFVKPVTDFAINSTPTVLKAAGNVAKSMWSFGRSAASYFSTNILGAAAAA